MGALAQLGAFPTCWEGVRHVETRLGTWFVSDVYFGRTRMFTVETFLKFLPPLKSFARVGCVPRTPPPCALEFEMHRTLLLLFLVLCNTFEFEMPRRKSPEAAERERERDREHKRRKRAEQSPRHDRARIKENRREQYAQESALQTAEEREQTNAHRRELRNEMDAEERERVNSIRREHDFHESVLNRLQSNGSKPTRDAVIYEMRWMQKSVKE